ncbi:hypothetical protein MANES_07G019100v8 [Manihot esculenta]|uniref:Uncharacterized protein n=1 Tax=Manihot esculenta TaxID=3983 RepID=A0ACB7HHD6_MANES|nr:hypothetical protein MANES_07G019100v8 [Manihot esculenta]
MTDMGSKTRNEKGPISTSFNGSKALAPEKGRAKTPGKKKKNLAFSTCFAGQPQTAPLLRVEPYLMCLLSFVDHLNELTMSTETQKKPGPPQIVRLDKALKLAEEWVNNMTKGTEEETTNVEPEGRPSKLGLGAKVVQRSNVGPLNDPVERKLHAKLEAEKRKAAKSFEESLPSTIEGGNGNGIDHDDSDGESESRTNAFAKKRAVPPAPTSSLRVKKKHK